MTDPTARLKRLYSKGNFGDEFIEASKDDLPLLFGRMELLEEFYGLNAPGLSDRSRNVHEQLSDPIPRQKGFLRRAWGAAFG